MFDVYALFCFLNKCIECAERPVFTRVIGELGQQIQKFARRGHEANASPSLVACFAATLR